MRGPAGMWPVWMARRRAVAAGRGRAGRPVANRASAEAVEGLGLAGPIAVHPEQGKHRPMAAALTGALRRSMLPRLVRAWATPGVPDLAAQGIPEMEMARRLLVAAMRTSTLPRLASAASPGRSPSSRNRASARHWCGPAGSGPAVTRQPRLTQRAGLADPVAGLAVEGQGLLVVAGRLVAARLPSMMPRLPARGPAPAWSPAAGTGQRLLVGARGLLVPSLAPGGAEAVQRPPRRPGRRPRGRRGGRGRKW